VAAGLLAVVVGEVDPTADGLVPAGPLLDLTTA
jgi:hypothetical protein